jgi:hypothetical protein
MTLGKLFNLFVSSSIKWKLMMPVL